MPHDTRSRAQNTRPLRAALLTRQEINLRVPDQMMGKYPSGGARAGHALLMRPKRPLPTLPFAKSAATPRPERCRSDHRGLSNPGALYLPRLSACHPDSDPDTVTIVVIASAAVNGPP